MITIPKIEEALTLVQGTNEKLHAEVSDLRADLANLREQLQVERNDNRITNCKVDNFYGAPIGTIR